MIQDLLILSPGCSHGRNCEVTLEVKGIVRKVTKRAEGSRVEGGNSYIE